jgi:hypothetical protein
MIFKSNYRGVEIEVQTDSSLFKKGDNYFDSLDKALRFIDWEVTLKETGTDKLIAYYGAFDKKYERVEVSPPCYSNTDNLSKYACINSGEEKGKVVQMFYLYADTEKNREMFKEIEDLQEKGKEMRKKMKELTNKLQPFSITKEGEEKC